LTSTDKSKWLQTQKNIIIITLTAVKTSRHVLEFLFVRKNLQNSFIEGAENVHHLLEDTRNFVASRCIVALEYTMFAPAQLLRNWREQRPSNMGDLNSSVRGRLVESVARGWICF
jgi:hypothetical protein